MTQPSRPAAWLELRVIRKKDGYTQSSLARAVGLSKSYMSELENGHRRPNPGIIKRIAIVLKVPFSVLEPRERA